MIQRTEQAPLKSGFGALTTAQQIAAGKNLNGKTIVITGGHSGIGLETTQVLTAAGAKVVVGARDLEKAKAHLSHLKNVEIFALDLAVPQSIDDFSNAVVRGNPQLDILINNAGIMAVPLMRDSRGFEMQLATNHFGHFQLTRNIFGNLKAGARVVNLTSAGHRFGGVDFQDPNFNHRPYEKWKAYGQSKTANSLFTVELDRRAQATGIRAFAVHPGRILETDLTRSLSEEELKPFGITKDNNGQVKEAPGVAMKNIPQGAATTVWCALSERLDGKGGVYCADCDISEKILDDSQNGAGVRQWAIDPAFALQLWSLTESLMGFKFL